MTSETVDEPLDGDAINELGAIMNELGYRNKMNVNHLLNFPGENDTSTEVLSVDEIVDNIAGHSKDEAEAETDDDTQPLVPVSRKEALKASTTLQNFLLQYEKATPGLFSALRTIKDEIQLDLKFNKKQTTIYSYFEKTA